MLLETSDWPGTEWGDVPASARATAARVERPAGVREPLTAHEQGVVAISLFDHRSSIDPPAGIAWLLGHLFGFRPVNQLADVKLEALRRYCIMRRLCGDALPPGEDDRIRTAGYSDAALEGVDKLLAVGRILH